MGTARWRRRAPGETPLEAARRELAEETGLDPAAVVDRWVPVHRDVWWKGKRRCRRFLPHRTRHRRHRTCDMPPDGMHDGRDGRQSPPALPRVPSSGPVGRRRSPPGRQGARSRAVRTPPGTAR
ncbi:NUDIX domain-containing protein [Streptomyces sp. ID05-39B]|uniref:NUDIX domain-containing protein n=1 Tax=Streptomyces sp. ID05-39B TaxID=3028664 RepID=UPI0029B28B31|nr:NUDIX domain-containing protein [Streptomyces sp. ID05-39B]MDX3531901.1 NUDIX domain-containing protein [Streptomyces sp. ID05-39B]